MALSEVETRSLGPDGRADSRLTTWTLGRKRFYTLVQRGRLPDVAYDHGRLLAKQVEEGVFPEILDTIASDTDASADLDTGTADTLLDALFSRITHDVFTAVSPEFRQAVAALENGYFDGLADPAFRSEDVVRACVAIDSGNIATGLQRLMKKKGHRRFAQVAEYAAGALLRFRRGRAADNRHTALLSDRDAMSRALDEGFRRRQPAGMGCTGFFCDAAGTADGKALHARTFDGAFFAWNSAPLLHFIDERPENGAWHPYVAVGTAGLIYPGGISGMNAAGIACSLHQMSTVNYATDRRGKGGYDVAPFVQQRILREASTLDEAVAIAEDSRHFASWTIVVSDAASGKALSIEINGREDEDGRYDGRVKASTAERRVVQTNHFLLDGMAERLAFWDDAHFTKTVGKWLETRARHDTVSGRLDQLAGNGLMDTTEGLGLMANHDDATLGGARRSFGRTVCKSYGLMGSIARAAPDRAPGVDEMWFTVGDRLPGPHASLAGFKIDWGAGTLTPAGDHVAATVPDAYRAAMEAYVGAFRTYARPMKSGRYLGRRPTDAEKQDIRREALKLLDRAVRLSEDAGIVDPSFRYIRARLYHEAGRAATGADRDAFLAAAARDWERLRELAEGDAVAMNAWEKALVHILSAATAHARDEGTDAARDALVAKGRKHIEEVVSAEFSDGRLHQDIKDWKRVAAAIEADGDTGDLPAIDWVTVE